MIMVMRTVSCPSPRRRPLRLLLGVCVLSFLLGQSVPAAEPSLAEAIAEIMPESGYLAPETDYLAASPAPALTEESSESKAGFELESSLPAEPAAASDIQRSLDELKEQISSLQAQLEKKQNVPDTSKKFSARPSGQIEWDSVLVDQSRENHAKYGDIDNDFATRDVRVGVKGEGYGNLSYEVTLGYTGCLSFKNVMLTAADLPLLSTARIGYFKVESGLNYAQNVYDNTFVDWESCDRAFQVGRRLGVASIHFSEDKNARLFTGVFTGKNLSIGDKKYANENCDNVGIILNTRLTVLPVHTETADGTLLEVLHLGAGFRWVDPGRDSVTGANNTTTLQVSPVDWLGDMPPLLAGKLDTNSYTMTNAEAAWQRGRFGILGEGHFGDYRGYGSAYGVSATGRFLLTPGAFQKYSKSNGTFGGISIPANTRFVDCENWTCLEGGGVWEIAAQWAWTDLDILRDAPQVSYYGRMNQYTVALNWYWNPQTRWGLNWIYAKPVSGTGGAVETASPLNTLACQVRFSF